MSDDVDVRAIESKLAREMIVRLHYSKRAPAASYAYGLFGGEDLIGAVTFHTPSSPQVKRSCAPEAPIVLELNRLVIDTPLPNAASRLVGGALRLLPACVVVSYADQGQHHVGYVYQATNFWYAGSSTPHDCEYLVEGKRVHPRTLAARGISDPKRWAAKNHIEAVGLEPKHRYVFVCGDRREAKALMKLVKWPLSREYPKGEPPRRNNYAALLL